MKTLTIRLADDDLQRIKALQHLHSGNRCSTINGTIRYALKLIEEYTGLHSKLAGLFTPTWEINQKKLKELNHKYGFLQNFLNDTKKPL